MTNDLKIADVSTTEEYSRVQFESAGLAGTIRVVEFYNTQPSWAEKGSDLSDSGYTAVEVITDPQLFTLSDGSDFVTDRVGFLVPTSIISTPMVCEPSALNGIMPSNRTKLAKIRGEHPSQVAYREAYGQRPASEVIDELISSREETEFAG